MSFEYLEFLKKKHLEETLNQAKHFVPPPPAPRPTLTLDIFKRPEPVATPKKPHLTLVK